jgi:hypothetical protein
MSACLHTGRFHSSHCCCSLCWASKCGAFREEAPPSAPRFVPRKSVGDSWGVWVVTALTWAMCMFFAYKFWEGLSQ